jgi:hypothetical protein
VDASRLSGGSRVVAEPGEVWRIIAHDIDRGSRQPTMPLGAYARMLRFYLL